MRIWRNWQTRKIQILVPVTVVQVQVLLSAPNLYNPNQVFPVGNGFGLFIYFERYENTYFPNGVLKRPESKPRGPRKKKLPK